MANCQLNCKPPVIPDKVHWPSNSNFMTVNSAVFSQGMTSQIFRKEAASASINFVQFHHKHQLLGEERQFFWINVKNFRNYIYCIRHICAASPSGTLSYSLLFRKLATIKYIASDVWLLHAYFRIPFTSKIGSLVVFETVCFCISTSTR